MHCARDLAPKCYQDGEDCDNPELMECIAKCQAEPNANECVPELNANLESIPVKMSKKALDGLAAAIERHNKKKK